MPTEKAKKTRGRPKGSLNKSYKISVEIPACCGVCGSTNLRYVDGSKPIERSIVVTIRGKQYDHVRWDRKVCANCNQRISVRRYTLNNNGNSIKQSLFEEVEPTDSE